MWRVRIRGGLHAACTLLLLIASTSLGQEAPRIGRGLAGGQFQYTVKKGDSFASIGARYGVAAAVLARANKLKTYAPLGRGQVIDVDNRHIVPGDVDDGILINLPQRMLFFFCEGTLAAYYPVGLGRPTWPTPTGSFEVLELRENPVWTVPESIQREMALEGKIVKKSVPPGPDNPLGDFWMGLSIGSYGIHGTIAPLSIYGFRTHGCIRLHPDDAAELFSKVSVGQPGEIIYEPVLLARLDNGRIFIEVHRDVYNKGLDPMETVHQLADSNKLSDMIDWMEVQAVLKAHEGIARDVTATNKSLPTKNPW